MADKFTNAMLAVIAASTTAIALKVYLPEANRIGVHLGAPTRADLKNALEAGDGRTQQTVMDIPMVFVRDGSVDINGTVQVEGSVSIEGPVEIEDR